MNYNDHSYAYRCKNCGEFERGWAAYEHCIPLRCARCKSRELKWIAGPKAKMETKSEARS
jgi:predicted Zn-ribbon and HTH transcriptional regulator